MAEHCLSNDDAAQRNSLLAKFDPTLWSGVADTVTDWIMHWWKEGKVRLVHRGTELPQGGRLDCRTNTYTDGFDSWSPVQVEWLPEVEVEPEPIAFNWPAEWLSEPVVPEITDTSIGFDAASFVVSPQKSNLETKEEAILRILTEAGRVDGPTLIISITQQAALEKAGDVVRGGYTETNRKWLQRWTDNTDNLKLLGEKLQAGTINKVKWAKQRNK